MANKLSDILLMVQNTQIRVALEKLASLAGISMGSTDSSAIVSDVTGDVTGDLTGDVTGSVDAPLVETDQFEMTGFPYTTDGAVNPVRAHVQLDASTGTVDMTIAAPATGKMMVLTCVDASNSVTVTLTAGTFDGTNEIATFDAAEETLVLFAISATRFVIVENIGSVALSTAA